MVLVFYIRLWLAGEHDKHSDSDDNIDAYEALASNLEESGSEETSSDDSYASNEIKKTKKIRKIRQLLLNLQKSLPMKKIEMQELLRGKLKRWIYLDLLYSDVSIIYNLSYLTVPVSIYIFKFYIIFIFIIIN